jgi:hypothetical protein
LFLFVSVFVSKLKLLLLDSEGLPVSASAGKFEYEAIEEVRDDGGEMREEALRGETDSLVGV